MKIYNSLTRRKEEFVPLEEGKVKMYACGITVSGEAHIGHAFQAMLYDIFRKFLEKQGYKVTYARNYTDVDDKIIARSKETGIPADKYAEMMIKKIDHVMREFDVDDPTLWLKATENIGNIISFVQALIASGHAYAADNGDVYFDVDTFPAYGSSRGGTRRTLWTACASKTTMQSATPTILRSGRRPSPARSAGIRRGVRGAPAGTSSARR